MDTLQLRKEAVDELKRVERLLADAYQLLDEIGDKHGYRRSN